MSSSFGNLSIPPTNFYVNVLAITCAVDMSNIQTVPRKHTTVKLYLATGRSLQETRAAL